MSVPVQRPVQRAGQMTVHGVVAAHQPILTWMIRADRPVTPHSDGDNGAKTLLSFATRRQARIIVPNLVYANDEGVSPPLYTEVTQAFKRDELEDYIATLQGVLDWLNEPFEYEDVPD